MLIEVRVPVLAESVAEATLMDWHKQPGDSVKFGDALIDVETDKVTLEVVAPEDGTLVNILKNSGEDVGSNELIAQIDTEGQASATETADIEEADVPEPGTPTDVTGSEAAPQAEPETEPAVEPGEQPPPSEQKPKSSPAVRKLLAEHGLEPRDIPASGNRLTKKEVLDYLAKAEDTGEDTQNDKPETAAEAPVTGKEQAREAGQTGNQAGSGRGRARSNEPAAQAGGATAAGGAAGKRDTDHVQ